MRNNFEVIKAMVLVLGFEHEYNGLDEPHAGCFTIPLEEGDYSDGKPTFFITRQNDMELCPTSLDEPVSLVCGNYGEEKTVIAYFPNINKLIEAYTNPGGESIDNLVVTMICEYDKMENRHTYVTLKKFAIVDIDTITVTKVIWAKDKESVKDDALLPGFPQSILLEEYEIQSLLEQLNEIVEE